MAYTNNYEINPEGFWNRFDELLLRQLKTENLENRKQFFEKHKISYQTVRNAKHEMRIPSVDNCNLYANLFNTTLDYLITGKYPQYYTKAQTVLLNKPDIEQIVLGLNELQPDEYEYITLWLQSINAKNKKITV